MGPAPAAGIALQPNFVAPPRTIADITAILDSGKSDPAKIAARKAADATPPANASPSKLAQFYYDRGNARALLARNHDALADGLQALAVAKAGIDYRQLVRIRQFAALQYRAIGNPKESIAMFETILRESDAPGKRGGLINAMSSIVATLIAIGDVSKATTYAGRVQQLVAEARGSPNPGWRSTYSIYGHSWEGSADTVRGMVLQARGQYADAEAAYRRAEAFHRAALKDLLRYDFPPPPELIVQVADATLLSVARNESRQGRQSEAEADARRALLEILKTQGKYSPVTPQFIIGLAGILVEQGRYKEAEQLGRSALNVQRTLGIADSSPESVHILSGIGNILAAQRKLKEAAAVYKEVDQATAQWTPQQREALELNGSRIAALYATDQVDEGIKAAEALVKRQIARTGANSFDVAGARGTLALGYAQAQRDADAVREFKSAIPILTAASEDNEDDPTLVAARNARLQRIVEAYIAVLARSPDALSDVAVETFGLADAIRGHAVQHALADSSARAAAKDSALAGPVRADQDHAKQINAELGALNNLLAQPSDQRDDQAVRAINAELEKLRTERKATRQEINKRFPAYANLIDPKPPTIDDIRVSLRPDEAMLSIYLGQDRSFVWAVPREGPVAFAAVPATAIEIEASVRKLRQALEPEVTTVSEIPQFDVDLAYQLYAKLLKPVESGWRSAKSLIVVTNGALGELPLGLLPTAPSQVDLEAKPLFAGYRIVPWLARTHAVTVVPSASALITLRKLPAGSPNRDRLIGFGDPYFNPQQAAEAEQELKTPVQVASVSADAGSVTRGVPLKLRASPHTEDVHTAELAQCRGCRTRAAN